MCLGLFASTFVVFDFLVFLLHDQLVHPVIKKFILWKCVNHAPALLSQLPDCLKHWHFQLLVDYLLENRHRDESPSSAHSRAAVNYRRFSFLVMSQKFLYHKVQRFFAILQRTIPIRPGRDLIMSDYTFPIVVQVLQMNLPDPQFFLLDFRHQCHFVLFLTHFSALCFLIWPVSIAFLPILLN